MECLLHIVDIQMCFMSVEWRKQGKNGQKANDGVSDSVR